ncbi:fluoride efflux transporter FluC [Halobaculum sp. P14]|uniref:fluoride efflux transporter FluC n=1 Tax=Halobaculum sp. P14 TaxID=3421638 RepID=UPI003EBE7A30
MTVAPGGVAAALLVAVGGAVGAAARHLVGLAVPGRRATAAVNVAGSVLLGAVGGAVAGGASPTLSLLVGAGFCGAFTTYSSFAVELQRLLAERNWRSAAAFGVGVLVAALLGAAAGYAAVS